MGDHSSENYLDQLLNSMHGEETEHPKEQQAAKQVLRDDFEKQLFGEEETKEKAKAKNEEDFLREFEEELLKEDIPEYTESLNQKKQEEKATQIDASLDDLLDNIPQDDFSTGDAAKEEETGFQGKSPLETAIPPDEDDFEVNTLDDAVGTFDSNLPKEEDGELDLSGLSDSDLMDMLSGDQDLSDLGDMLSSDQDGKPLEETDSIGDFARSEMNPQEEVADKLILIPRIYTNKPRTTGDGYKGIVHQPDPEKKEDFLHGLIAMRHMHIRALSETGLSAADEMLYPENWGYVSDILSYVAIGARSVEDQQHRLTVSGFDLPSGMKNPTSGDFSVMLNSVYAAQHPHRFIYRGYEVQTNGNDLAHTVLRGATSKHGRNIPNYHYEDLQILLGLYNERDLKNPACIIDSNHSNSNKQFDQQVRIVKEVMHSRHLSPDIHNFVKGVMIESYIEEGNQKVGGGVYGKSITDACLGWEASERLIYDLAELNY